METQLPLPKKGAEPPPQFSADVYCVQTARWIKVPLGMEVGLHPSDIVLDGDPAPLPKRGNSPSIFGPCLLWPNGWMDQDATWYTKVGLGPGRIVLHGNPVPLSGKGNSPLLNFRPVSIVAKRSPILAVMRQLLKHFV